MVMVIAVYGYKARGELLYRTGFDDCEASATNQFECGQVTVDFAALPGGTSPNVAIADVEIIKSGNSSYTTKALRIGAISTASLNFGLLLGDLQNVSFSFDAVGGEIGATAWAYIYRKNLTELSKPRGAPFIGIDNCDSEAPNKCQNFTRFSVPKSDDDPLLVSSIFWFVTTRKPNTYLYIDNFEITGDIPDFTLPPVPSTATPTSIPSSSPTSSRPTSDPTVQSLSPTGSPTKSAAPSKSPTSTPDQTLPIVASSIGAASALLLAALIFYARRKNRTLEAIDILEKEPPKRAYESLTLEHEQPEGRVAIFLDEYVPKKRKANDDAQQEKTSDANPRKTYLERVQRDSGRRSVFRPSPSYLNKFKSEQRKSDRIQSHVNTKETIENAESDIDDVQ